MLTVDDYGAIRRARCDGKSIRQIASEFDHSRNTIRKILKQAEPNPLPSTRDRLAPRLGPVQAFIDQASATTRTPRPSSAIPPPRSSDVSATNRDTAADMPRCNAICSNIDAGIRRPSSLWGISRAGGSRPISVTSRLTSPRGVARFPSS